MNLFFLLLFGSYFVGMILLMAGWRRSITQKSFVGDGDASLKKITVVVPFRNEEERIADVVQDIFRLDYPAEKVEAIFVDDHSTDHSCEIISRHITGHTNVRLVSLPEGIEGKKQAITCGIERAGSEIIATTDADCRLPVRWLRLIYSSFRDPKVKMVLGGIRIPGGKSFFSELQSMEFISLVGTGGAMSGLGLPVMCNGANLSFLKSVFVQVKGYEGNLDVPSGDDEYLMHKIHRRFPGSVIFQASQDSVVETKPLASVGAFVAQRLRWAGKWKHSGSRASQLIAFFVLVIQISFLALWAAPFLNWVTGYFASILIAIKLILEFIFVFQVGTFLRLRQRPAHFLVLQFLYPFYVIFSGVAALFLSPEWKGRRV